MTTCVWSCDFKCMEIRDEAQLASFIRAHKVVNDDQLFKSVLVNIFFDLR